MAAKWPRILTVETAAIDAVKHIESTADAAYYLLDHWTKNRSPAYSHAVRMCSKAIKGEIAHEAAYIAFVAAARDANFALLSNRRINGSDQFEIDVERSLAESILADLKNNWK